MKFLAPAAAVLLASLLVSCGGGGGYRQVSARHGVPQFVELHDTHTINTFHFPAGTYTLEAEDNDGYYYRAPVRLAQQSFTGQMPHDGGIFVRKGKRRSMRGYVVWAAGRTRIGNLTHARHTFGY
jgi:hypothetical protein